MTFEPGVEPPIRAASVRLNEEEASLLESSVPRASDWVTEVGIVKLEENVLDPMVPTNPMTRVEEALNNFVAKVVASPYKVRLMLMGPVLTSCNACPGTKMLPI